MKKFTLILFASVLLATTGVAQAANHYIRAGATGANNGSSWTNAWTSFSSVVWTRGDTYYVAGGDYSQLVKSGTVSDDGTTTTLIDRTTNFAAAGVVYNKAWVGDLTSQTSGFVGSVGGGITTTYNTNDTLNFAGYTLAVPSKAGDSYLVYNQVTIPSLSGTGWITIKKANAADNGADAGWDSSYANTPAVLSRLVIQTGYVRIDGVTGSGISGHGIKIYDPIGMTVLSVDNSVPGPYEFLHLEVKGPGFDYGKKTSGGIYHNGMPSGTKGIHISNCWIHEIPNNGLTFGTANGTSYEDYGLLFENNVLERTGGLGMRYPGLHGQAMQFMSYPVSYAIFRNNIFRNNTGQADISILGGTPVNYIRIYNNIFSSDNGDCPVYGIADAGSNASIIQFSRQFSAYEALTGKVLTNITKGATGVITSVASGVSSPTSPSAGAIYISAGMSGGAVNEPGDEFSFSIPCRSAYTLATPIYSSAGNPITNAEVYNNTLYNIHNAQIAFVTPSDMTGSVARNNIWAKAWFTTRAFTPPSSNTGYYNCKDGQDKPADTESADPFVNSAVYDFRLKSTANAVNGGTNLSSIFTTDKDGTSRPQGSNWDIGAYEYVEGGAGVIYGDVSGDGAVSAYDSALTARAAVGLDTLTAEQRGKADVSGDGAVSAYDAALIAQKAVGLIDRFPVEG